MESLATVLFILGLAVLTIVAGVLLVLGGISLAGSLRLWWWKRGSARRRRYL